MQNSVSIEILKSFDKTELKIFEDLIRSPYFNKKTNVVKLFNLIKKHAPEYKSDKLEREYIWKQLFPDKNFNYGVLKNLIYDLTKLAEKFLIIESSKKDKLQEELTLLSSLSEKKLNRIYDIKYKALTKLLSQASGYFEELYKKQLELSTINRNHIFFNSPADVRSNEFSKETEYLTYYFIIRLISAYNSYTTQKLMTRTETPDAFTELLCKLIPIERIIDIIKTISNEDHRKLMFSFKKFRAISQPNDIFYYFDYKDHIINNFEFLSKEEKYNVLNSLTTIIGVLNFDPYFKLIEYNKIHKLRVKYNLVITKEGLSPVIYANIVNNSGRLKDIEFLENFIKKYHEMLPENHKKNMVNFGNAYISFANNNFFESLEYLSRINYDLFNYKFYVKDLQIMLYYETNNYESFSYSRDNYKHFLKHNKTLDPNRKEMSNNLMKYIEYLFRIKDSKDMMALQLLKEHISKHEKLTMKHWFIEKAEEIEKICNKTS